MSEEYEEVRFVIETLDGVYCVSDFNSIEEELIFTEGDGEVHRIPKTNILKVRKEVIVSTDITEELTKEVALV